MTQLVVVLPAMLERFELSRQKIKYVENSDGNRINLRLNGTLDSFFVPFVGKSMDLFFGTHDIDFNSLQKPATDGSPLAQIM